MPKKKRSQFGRAIQTRSRLLDARTSPPIASELSLVPSSTEVKNGSSLQADRVINAYIDGWQLVVIFDNGKDRISRRFKAEYSSFIKAGEEGYLTVDSDELYRMLRQSNAVTAIREEDGWLRVCWKDGPTRKKYCKALHENGVYTHDGNVDPFTRWMLDNPSSQVVPGRVGFLDLENNSILSFSRVNEMRLVSWALVCEEGEFVESLSDDSAMAETNLLRNLWRTLEHVDQVAAWNGDVFDFRLLTSRTLSRGLRPVFDKWLWLDHMKLFERMNMMAAESGDEKQSMALDAISHVVLGERKIDFDASKVWEYWKAGGEKRDFLEKYNLRDAQLMAMLEEKTGYIALLNTLATACGTRPDSRGMLPTVQIESLLQHLAAKRQTKFITTFEGRRRKHEDDTANFRGAYVMEPTAKGIIKNVHVADFSSLYPTIIRTWNMSAETKSAPKVSPPRVIDACVKQGDRVIKYSDSKCVTPITGIVFNKEPEGLLSGAVAEMMRLRKEWNDKKANAIPGTAEWVDADRRSTAYKIAANSCYGAIGRPSFRHHDVDVAESVSQAAVWLIKQTIKAAEEEGFQVLYSDTDSIFVMGCTSEEFAEFVNKCNSELYPRILNLLGCESRLINLAYEKAFERIVILTKKRYCGRYSHYKGTAATKDSKAEVKGLEYKRGDSIRLARRLQAKIVDMLVGQENGGIEDPTFYCDCLTRWREHVLNGALELDDVVISKSLGKPLKDYSTRLKKDGSEVSQLPHIRIAKILKERGHDIDMGSRISYVIRDGSKRPLDVIPAIDWTGEVDRASVWESLVAPPTIRVMEAAFPGEDWRPFKKARDFTEGLFDREN